MLIQAYSEAVEDGQQTARHEERVILELSVEKMLLSDENQADKQKRIEAINYTTRVWSYLLNDLASTENESADEFKAAMISIGIFIMKHLDRMRKEPSVPFKPVCEISKTILEGLG